MYGPLPSESSCKDTLPPGPKSALGFGGETAPTDVLANTESWNGTNWTEVNDLNTARRLLSGTGTDNTNCLAAGGYDGTAYTAKTESWNGTNWTNENNLRVCRES